MSAVLLAVVCASAWAGPLRRTTKATHGADAKVLMGQLGHKHAWVRELAAQGLATTPASEPAVEALQACLDNSDERGFVRAACAGTLGRWGVADAIPAMATALTEVDPESRYWVASALHVLHHPDAQAIVEDLRADGDLLLAAAAREWSR